jgi:glycine/D-amino acid oxidase-like deaminating enzyme
MMTQDGAGEAEPGRVFELNCDSIVVAGGAWSPTAMKLLGLRNWTEPIRRQVCIVDNRETNLANYGMIVDTSGVYFHNEGPHILAGYSPPDEPPGYHFNYDGEPFFVNEIWPRLFARMSVMERIRHVTGWAGLYEVSPDRSGIVGLAAPRVYEAHSFSGRGVMQSYGAGQALADLIAQGKYGAFDATALSRDRFDRNEQVWEELHI